MQQDSIQLVTETLNAGKKIRFAGIGVLGLRYIEAHIHPVSRIFSPPHYEVVLFEETEEGLIIPAVDELAVEIRQQLKNNEEFTVLGLGTFMLTKTNEFVFVPQDSLSEAVNAVMKILPEVPVAYSERKRPEATADGISVQKTKRKKRTGIWLIPIIFVAGSIAAIYFSGIADQWINSSSESLTSAKDTTGSKQEAVPGKITEIEDTTVADQTELPVTEDKTRDSYHIIIGSYTALEPARKDSQLWVNKGYQPSIIPFPEKNRFRLSIAHYPDSAGAKSALPAIRTQVNSGAWILKN